MSKDVAQLIKQLDPMNSHNDLFFSKNVFPTNIPTRVNILTKKLIDKSANAKLKHKMHVELFLSSFEMRIDPIIRKLPDKPIITPRRVKIVYGK